jgi:hypothetical protein
VSANLSETTLGQFLEEIAAKDAKFASILLKIKAYYQ